MDGRTDGWMDDGQTDGWMVDDILVTHKKILLDLGILAQGCCWMLVV